MAIGSIKITELPSNNELNDNDLFLTSSALGGGDIYESKKLTFLNLWEKLKEKISGWTNAIINGDWTFKGKVNFNNKTTIDTGAIVDGEHSTSIINAEFLYNFITGGNYPENMIMPSYVGMIIHSTTLNTLSAVKTRYGSKTNWIQYDEFFLRSCPPGKTVIQKKNTKDAHSDAIKLTAKNIPAHYHEVPAHTHKITHDIHCSSRNMYFDHLGTTTASGSNNQVFGINEHKSTPSIKGGVTCSNCDPFNTSSYGDGQEFSIVPAFKFVYIWERIS